jgi:hypothetical protein
MLLMEMLTIGREKEWGNPLFRIVIVLVTRIVYTYHSLLKRQGFSATKTWNRLYNDMKTVDL